jgi:aminoglycoside phosphotransferase (APT) family kinase protein
MAPPKRHDHEVPVDDELVGRLLRAQAPELADRPRRVVEPTGTDHTLYRLGDDLVARLPIYDGAARQAAKEARWVPFLAPQLPLALPTPYALCEPDEGYPFCWSIVSWIDGERAAPSTIDLERAATDLARFVRTLQSCDATGGPPAGADTGHRGLPLHGWDERVREWIAKAERDDCPVDLPAAVAAWEEVLAAPDWDRPPVWFHGDLPGNLIARDRRLVGVIDSGYGVGDPACDLLAGWTMFRGAARARFFAEVGLDDATITRARGWALAPAFIGLTYYRDVPHLRAMAISAIDGALAD